MNCDVINTTNTNPNNVSNQGDTNCLNVNTNSYKEFDEMEMDTVTEEVIVSEIAEPMEIDQLIDDNQEVVSGFDAETLNVPPIDKECANTTTNHEKQADPEESSKNTDKNPSNTNDLAVPTLLTEPIVINKPIASATLVKTPTIDPKPVSPLKNIAPKPFKLAKPLKPLSQQIMLIQSPGGGTNAVNLATGQPIKLISATGQPVTFAQLPKTTKSATLMGDGKPKKVLGATPIISKINFTTINNKNWQTKSLTPLTKKLKPLSAGVSAINTSVPKKIIFPSPSNVKTNVVPLVKMVPATNSASAIVSVTGTTVATTPTLVTASTSVAQPVPSGKTITLAQAQEMGLLTQAKFHQLTGNVNMSVANTSVANTPSKQLVINSRAIPKGAQIVKLTPSSMSLITKQSPVVPAKSPTKILPATQKIMSKPSVVTPTTSGIISGRKLITIKQATPIKVLSDATTTTATTSVTQQSKTITLQTATTVASQVNQPQLLRLAPNQVTVPISASMLNANKSGLPQGANIQYLRIIPTSSISAASPGQNAKLTWTMASNKMVTTSNSPGTKLPTVVPLAFVNSKTQPGNLVKVIPFHQTTGATSSSIPPGAKLVPKAHIFTPNSLALSSAQLAVLTNKSPNASGNRQFELNQSARATETRTTNASVTGAVDNMSQPVVIKTEPKFPDTNESESDSANMNENGGRGTPPLEQFANMTVAFSNSNSAYQRRRPCNCTKSQCLKLYCDCFANGEFCSLCNCISCFNNLKNEGERGKAIRNCLERNPLAFKPKIGNNRDPMGDDSMRKHTKGCNCKRSGCLKNYCECYEAKIICSAICRCLGCRNIEDALYEKDQDVEYMVQYPPMPTDVVSNNNDSSCEDVKPEPFMDFKTSIRNFGNSFRANSSYYDKISQSSPKFPIAFMTPEVIEATCQCLIARARETEMNKLSDENSERQILEEFGKCLTEIIRCVNNTAKSDIDHDLLLP